jgi:hypothetical protein
VASSSILSKAGILALLGKILKKHSGLLISSLMLQLQSGKRSFHGFDAWSQADLSYKSLNQVNPEDDIDEEANVELSLESNSQSAETEE